MRITNRFFLYDEEDNNILRAANYKLYEVMKYWQEGRRVFYGTPNNHLKDITHQVKDTNVLYGAYKNECNEIESNLINN